MGIGVKKQKLEKKQKIIGWMFLAPAVILIILFMFYPIIQAFITSFYTGNASKMAWAGIKNYARMFKDPKLLKAIKNTLFFAVWQVADNACNGIDPCSNIKQKRFKVS